MPMDKGAVSNTQGRSWYCPPRNSKPFPLSRTGMSRRVGTVNCDRMLDNLGTLWRR